MTALMLIVEVIYFRYEGQNHGIAVLLEAGYASKAGFVQTTRWNRGIVDAD